MGQITQPQGSTPCYERVCLAPCNLHSQCLLQWHQLQKKLIVLHDCIVKYPPSTKNTHTHTHYAADSKGQHALFAELQRMPNIRIMHPHDYAKKHDRQVACPSNGNGTTSISPHLAKSYRQPHKRDEAQKFKATMSFLCKQHHIHTLTHTHTRPCARMHPQRWTEGGRGARAHTHARECACMRVCACV